MSITREQALDNARQFTEHFKLLNGLSPRTIAAAATSPEGIAMLTGSGELLKGKVYTSSVSVTTPVHEEFKEDYSRTIQVVNPAYNKDLPISALNPTHIDKVITQTVLDRLELISDFDQRPFDAIKPVDGEKWKVDMADSNIYDQLTDQFAFFNHVINSESLTNDTMINHIVNFAQLLSDNIADGVEVDKIAAVFEAKWAKLADAPYDIAPIFHKVMIKELDRDTSKFPEVVEDLGADPQVQASTQLLEFLKVHSSIRVEPAQDTFAKLDNEPVLVDFTKQSFTQDTGTTDQASADAAFTAAMIAISKPVVDVESTVTLPATELLQNAALKVTFPIPALWVQSEPLLSDISGVTLATATWADVVGKTLVLDYTSIAPYRNADATGLIMESKAISLVANATQ